MSLNKNVLIVYAHPEPTSFTGSMKDVSVKTLESMGCNVKVSDLHSMHFKATTSKDDIMGEITATRFDYLNEKSAAVKEGRLSQDIMDEIEKIEWADLLILHFPMHWFSMPAIMKGWFDRVYVFDRIFTPQQMYSTGKFKGKRAIIATSTGGSEVVFKKGIHGDMSIFLWPIQSGLLYFVGYDALKPNVCFNVRSINDEARKKMIDQWANRLQGIFDEEPEQFLSRDDFERNGFGQIKPESLEKAMKNGTLPVGQKVQNLL
uniref:ribosyldihydronicotinamide dehydrogenase [quinone]-like n=1 Tax=Styela clava TaxID=7725 RepID=UPI00193A3792|nr:ribosyldihydronicotinamide dehydrogenase [quinone]-like [Styela clava]